MKLVSIENDRLYDARQPVWQSAEGHLLDLEFEAAFDLRKIAAASPGMWRYSDAIPADAANAVSFGEGFTPLLPVVLGGIKMFVKQEQLFTSGSYKDRGAAVLMSHAASIGIKHVVQDSSGNAGCAIAAYAAKAGIACDIFVPEDTSPAKLVQIGLYGAHIHKIPGTREDTASAAYAAAQKSYYASHCRNPFFFHGTKTFAYEICEQLGWKAPDTVVLPAGNGTLVIGCYIGFTDLLRAGIIGKMPKLIAVQAAACAPLVHAFKNGSEDAALIGTSPTLAEGIAIARPVRAAQMLRYVRETKGMFISVSEDEIRHALRLCLSQGYYIEPTSAATIAGVIKYAEGFGTENLVTLFSGHGLKSTEKLEKFL